VLLEGAASVQMEASMTTIKIVYGEDIRRISVSKDHPYDRVVKEISRIYPGKFPKGMHIRYVDDEDDEVTVTCNMELKDALDLGESTLKLFITPKTETPARESGFVKVSKDGQRAVTISKPSEMNLPEIDSKHRDTADDIEVSSAEIDLTEKRAEKQQAKAEKQQAKAEKQQAKAEKEQAKTEKQQVTKAEKERAMRAEKEAKKAEREAKKAERQAKKAAKRSAKAMLANLNCKFLSDVTYPDETKVQAGSRIVKTWLVKNTGSIAWPQEVSFRVTGKGTLESVREFEIPMLKPGEEGKLSVELGVPQRNGKLKSKVYCLSLGGKRFGDNFWAIIRAEKQKQKNVQKNEDVKFTVPKNKMVLGAHFLKDLNFPDDVLVAPGQTIEKSWLIKNTGECAWPIETKLVHIEGNFGQGTGSEIKTTVRKGEQYRLTVRLNAPQTTGKFTASYRLQSPTGDKFGHKYWINVQVSKFPNREQLKNLFKNFLGDQKVVDTLHEEFPFVIKEVRQGKGLASIVEAIVKKHPELAKHQFVIFIQPFLHSAEKFMNMQMDTLISMYAFWAMTPFAAGATIPKTQEPKMPAREKKAKLEENENVKSEETVKAEKKSYREALSKKEGKYEEQLRHFKSMGFKNLEKVEPLLEKHNGNIQAVMNELFNNSA